MKLCIYDHVFLWPCIHMSLHRTHIAYLFTHIQTQCTSTKKTYACTMRQSYTYIYANSYKHMNIHKMYIQTHIHILTWIHRHMHIHVYVHLHLPKHMHTCTQQTKRTQSWITQSQWLLKNFQDATKNLRKSK